MKLRPIAFAAWIALVGVPVVGWAALDATETVWDGGDPPTGVYFQWYEPSFYTGFAPRTQDPGRLTIVLGRGNQVRVTIVLADAEIDSYLEDLDARHRIYQELVDAKILQLSTNKEYEKFVQSLEEQGVRTALAMRGETRATSWRERNVQAMEALNPGRVFRVHRSEDLLAKDWHANLAAADLSSATARLDVANSIFPGRVHLTALSSTLEAALSAAAERAKAGTSDSPEFRSAVRMFLEAATAGRYRVRDGFVDGVEFTALYPAGTADATTTYKGEKLPDFGVTGVWPLIRREQGRGIVGMVDYLSTNPGYGFIPLLAYQHASGIAYNSFHNAGVRCALGSTDFLPKSWRTAVSERDGKPMQNLWIVGRGPTSHGCTRLPSGHMTELRHVAPAESAQLTEVRTFRNLPQCYDVFDLRGDGAAQVMGVQYYLAYKSKEHTPVRSSVSNRREPFYRWLYGANIELAAVGAAKLKSVPVCRFVGRKASESATLANVPLFEATYTPEAIQFYRLKPTSFEGAPGFEFNRELRKVGAGHKTNRKALFLP